MNWSEPSIRAEQALKRANQAAEDKKWNLAYLEYSTAQGHLLLLAQEAYTRWQALQNERSHT